MADNDFMAKVKIVARETAREVVRELQNEHGLVNLDEARQVLNAQSNVSEFECASCHFPIKDPTAARCPKCGSKAAIVSTNSPYRCERCGRPVDLEDSACVCGHTRAVPIEGKTNPVFYTCHRCLKPVAMSQPRCNSCGCTKVVRTIEV